MAFALFLGLVALLRLGELLLARRNERWLRRHGAVEYGRGHYRYLVLLHALFFAALVIEYAVTPAAAFSPPLFAAYLLVVAFKAWAIASLGPCWNTKIFRIPGTPLVRRGPYRFLRHPNYLAVVAEIVLIPLVFHLWVTAVVFTLLNALALRVRIREENRALSL